MVMKFPKQIKNSKIDIDGFRAFTINMYDTDDQTVINKIVAKCGSIKDTNRCTLAVKIFKCFLDATREFNLKYKD